MSNNSIWALPILAGAAALMAGAFKNGAAPAPGQTPAPLITPNDPGQPGAPGGSPGPLTPAPDIPPAPIGELVPGQTPPGENHTTKLERMAAWSKTNTDPGIKYCPVCFTRFYQGFINDGESGWHKYNWHVIGHSSPNEGIRRSLWSESCPFDSVWFYDVDEFVAHLANDHNYQVKM